MLNFPNRLIINGTEWNDRPLKFDVNCINCKTKPTWRDVVISGITALTLVNAKADGLNYLKLYGGCEKDFTPISMDYETVSNMQHSTFDLSKFTVVGGSTITDAGLVTDTAVWDKYVQIPINKLDVTSPFEVNFRVIKNTFTSNNQLIGGGGSSSNITIYASGSRYGDCRVRVYDSNTAQSSEVRVVSSWDDVQAIPDNTSVDVNISWDGTNYYYKVTNVSNGTVYANTSATSNLPLDTINYNNIIGNFVTSSGCYFDLKNTYIIQGGVIVFSGNITGTDTYTVNGSTVSIPYTLSSMGDKIAESAYLTSIQAVIENLQTSTYIVINNSNQTATDYRGRIICNNGEIKARHQSGLPLGYTLVEYIKSTSNIPLGFYTNQNSEIEAKWYKDGAGAQYAYQANSGASLTNNTTAYTTDVGGNWRFGDKTISILSPLSIDVISIQNKNGVWFNNEQQGTYTNVNDFTGDVPFKALGSPSTGYSPMIRLSYIKHRQNGVLLGHYVPCVAPDNSIGLYDLIGGGFYTNSDATITAGNSVSDPIEIYTDGTTETVEVDTTGDIATAEMLLKVGDYQDVQSVLDGEVTRNVGIKVLDGTENWQDHGTYSDIKLLYITGSYAGAAQAITSTHYVGTSERNADMPVNSIKLSRPDISDTSGTIYIKTDSLTLANFKTYLAQQYANGTPVIVVYPLATATTETVTAQPLTIQAGTNVVEITQASMDNLELEVSYKAGVTVTIEQIEAVNLDNNVEVTING